MSLTQSLEKLVDTWEESRGVSMRLHLQPGLTRAEVQAALSPLDLIPPEELHELYQWHDGMDDLYEPDTLFGEHQFLPLKDAVEQYNEFRQYYDKGWEDLSINLNKCFPFAFFMGDICTIYCDPTPIYGLQHPVIGIYHAIDVYCENIDLMAQTVTKWLMAGIYGNDNTVDEELRRAIRIRLNPRIPDPTPGL